MKNIPILSAVCFAAVANAQWQPAAPATSPPARFYCGMTYDLGGARSILFGGNPTVGFTPHSDTWAYDGTNWSQLSPPTSPPGRGGMEIVYDSLRGVVVMYGGLNTSPIGGPSRNDTWEFDGTTWTQITTANTPGGWGWYGMAYDSVRSRTVLYGGMPNNRGPIFPDSDQTWEYDGTNWVQRTPATNPGPLENPAMCFHQGLGKVILFGGINVFTGGTDTTWSYDGTNWASIPVVGPRPAVRTLAKMVYDTSRNLCVLHGGMDPTNGNLFNDTWEFDGTAWTQRVSAQPVGRRGPGFAYDIARSGSVLFGGVDSTFTGLTDTHDYGALIEPFGTGCPGSNGTPILSANSGARLGGTFTTTVSNVAVGSTTAVFAYGFSDTFDGLTPLPLDLSIVGLFGCTQWHSADIIEFDAVVGTTSTHLVPVPNAPHLTGVRYFASGVSMDPFSPIGLIPSRPLRGFIGF